MKAPFLMPQNHKEKTMKAIIPARLMIFPFAAGGLDGFLRFFK